MDYQFSQEQEMFRKSVYDFLQKECPPAMVRNVVEKGEDYPWELYRKMAELGWLQLLIPENYGGMGGNWVDVAIFYEEAGRVLLPSPHFTSAVLGAEAILALGNEEQKKRYLHQIASGDLILTLALSEVEATSDLKMVTTSAVAQDNTYVINGTKLFILDGEYADWFITAAKLGPPDTGITLFMISKNSVGLRCIPLNSLLFSGLKLSQVNYEGVNVTRENILGDIGKGESITEVVDKGKIATCAEMVGGAERALEMTIEHTGQRQQFDVSISSFQALQHRMADMALAIEGTRWLIYYVAWLQSQGLPCARERAMAQLQTGETYEKVAAEATQMHGGVGIMREHDMTLYYSRAKATKVILGYPEDIRETIVQSLDI